MMTIITTTVIFIIISLIVFYYLKYHYIPTPIQLEEPKIPQLLVYSKCNAQIKKIKILSYNILAQQFMKRKDIKALTLENRLRAIIKEISLDDPDIFCLQEVTYDSFRLFIKIQFQATYHLESINNCSSSLMNVTGFKLDRFKLKNKYEFDLANENVTGNRGIMYTLLYDRQSNNDLSLYNVHFPWRPIYDNEKAYLQLKIFKHILEAKERHVIIAGDFNSLVNSLVVRMVYYEGFIKELKGDYNSDESNSFEFKKCETRLIDEIKEHMKKKNNFKERVMIMLNICKQINDEYFMRSSYGEYRNIIEKGNPFAFLRNHPEYTNYTMNFKETIDYIFYSKAFKILKIATLKDSKDYLPNLQFPSDHYKLYSEYEYL